MVVRAGPGGRSAVSTRSRLGRVDAKKKQA
jgi:hypothetical protein